MLANHGNGPQSKHKPGAAPMRTPMLLTASGSIVKVTDRELVDATPGTHGRGCAMSVGDTWVSVDALWWCNSGRWVQADDATSKEGAIVVVFYQFSVFSLVLGPFGACNQPALRSLFAYSTIWCALYQGHSHCVRRHPWSDPLTVCSWSECYGGDALVLRSIQWRCVHGQRNALKVRSWTEQRPEQHSGRARTDKSTVIKRSWSEQHGGSASMVRATQWRCIHFQSNTVTVHSFRINWHCDCGVGHVQVGVGHCGAGAEHPQGQ